MDIFFLGGGGGNHKIRLHLGVISMHCEGSGDDVQGAGQIEHWLIKYSIN